MSAVKADVDVRIVSRACQPGEALWIGQAGTDVSSAHEFMWLPKSRRGSRVTIRFYRAKSVSTLVPLGGRRATLA